MTHKEPLLELTLKECLKAFPEHKPDDEIFVIRDDETLYCGYNTNWEQFGLPRPVAGFDLEITGTNCYILWLGVREDMRGKGHGCKLVEIIEKFAKEMACADIHVAPSGMGHAFWPKRGYERKDATSLQKRIAIPV